MRILLGMSGGIDSTYAVKKMLEEGHDVVGAVLRMHEHTDVASAVNCARELGINIEVIDCTEKFKKNVVDEFASEYLRGRTPNPCVICNSTVKFDVLYKYAEENGFDKIATGHYARIINENGRYFVGFAADEKKDQTYVLWRLNQKILSKLIFPLSDMKKSEVRERSLEENLPSANAKESQEICFIPDTDYAGYIERNYGASPKGKFIDTDGNVLGVHKGIIHYTIGQRKGLGIAMGKRMFVSAIDVENNTVVLSDEKMKKSDNIMVDGIVFSGIEAKKGDKYNMMVKFRYTAPKLRAEVLFETENTVRVSVMGEAISVTSGQSAVFYTEKGIAFGGFIR